MRNCDPLCKSPFWEGDHASLLVIEHPGSIQKILAYWGGILRAFWERKGGGGESGSWTWMCLMDLLLSSVRKAQISCCDDLALISKDWFDPSPISHLLGMGDASNKFILVKILLPKHRTQGLSLHEIKRLLVLSRVFFFF